MVAPARREPAGSQVTPRTIVTVCATGLAIAAGVFFLVKTEVAVMLTLGAAVVAMALDHGVTVLERRHMKRGLAIALVVFVCVAIGVALGFLVIPPAVDQGRALATEAPSLWRRIQGEHLYQVINREVDIEAGLKQSVTTAAGAVSPVLNALSGLVNMVGGGLMLIFLAIFMLVFGGSLVHEVLAELQPAHQERYERVITSVYHSVGGYLGGLFGICAINGTLTLTFLAIIRMPFFVALGILSGLSSLVPYAGSVVMASVTTVLVFITGGPWKALATLIYYVLYGQLEGNVLGPFIYRRTVHINPLVTLLAVLFLGEFQGVAGAVIAVPVAAAGQIIVRELLLLHRDLRMAAVLPPGPVR